MENVLIYCFGNMFDKSNMIYASSPQKERNLEKKSKYFEDKKYKNSSFLYDELNKTSKYLPPYIAALKAFCVMSNEFNICPNTYFKQRSHILR